MGQPERTPAQLVTRQEAKAILRVATTIARCALQKLQKVQFASKPVQKHLRPLFFAYAWLLMASATTGNSEKTASNCPLRSCDNCDSRDAIEVRLSLTDDKLLPTENQRVSWKPFEFGITVLRSLDGVVGEDSGIVHSTRPERATGDDDISYFVKGPETDIVFAELAGCVLANAVGLPVPCARVCTFEGRALAGTRKISQLRAAIDLFILKPELVTNYASIFDAIVVDVWLGNYDRNMGNVVGAPSGGSKIDFVFIDFEKSTALREHPNIMTAQRPPRDFWPSEDLGRLTKHRKPLFPPTAMLDRIRAMDEERCLEIAAEISDAIGGVIWHKDTAFALASRASRIDELAREVWA